MRVRVLLVELDSLQGCIQTFPDVIICRLAPAIRDYASADASEPDVSFGQLGVEFARLPEEVSRFEVRFATYVMKMPSALTHQVPRRHIAAVTRTSRQRLGLEKLRFDGARHAFGNRVLNGKDFCQLHRILLGPDLAG